MKRLLQISAFCTMVLLIGLSSGCRKDEFNPNVVPTIEFKTVDLYVDTAKGEKLVKLIVSFTDGDGDVGLSQEDTIGDYGFNSPYYNNLFVEYYEFFNDEWLPVTIRNDFGRLDTVNFNGRVPVLTPAGRHKAIKGDIEYTIDMSAGTKLSNIIKYRVTLVDRALNKSNATESPVIYF